MPFTLSHVAAILPVRRWLPPSALAVGAMVPDLPYYLPLPFSSASTHAWWGPPLLGVPAGVVLLALLHWVLRAPLAALAPEGLRARLPDAARPAPVAVVAVVAALLAGMATHLVWDGFTQVGGFAVAHWQVLRLPVIGPHRVFNVLMYASSAGGLVALAGWLALWYRRTPVRPGRLPGLAGRVRGAVLAAVAGAGIAGAAAGAMTDRAAVSDYDLVRSMILGGADGAALLLAGYVLIWHVRNMMCIRRAAPDAGPSA
ncbi:DUF4184 family protein [Nonomuraea zeae]|uniref:DUF4184 family protein n=1 Tax=Nonomuraea zeae TaxID=1642303 RepID=A0A5S4GR33_9ACTN|nr:DUF4184 family protein [Nonomuraea zeae]TMR35001.1 DUF4184 family protein [Nonomuraea zeae]